MKMTTKIIWVLLAQVLILCFFYEHAESAAIMGPADMIIKYTEKCTWTLPTFVDANILAYMRKGKMIFEMNASLPFKLSDYMGVDTNVAVKRNGGWKPNFFKFRGGGLCTLISKASPSQFKVMGEQLKARTPYKCPLPSGTFRINFATDLNSFQDASSLSVVPYGEYRIDTNVTHKNDIVDCYKFYIEASPKKKTRG